MTSTALPPRFLATALVALGLNGVWAVTLPTASGRIVAGFGVLVSALFLLAVFASRTVRQRLTSNPPAFFRYRVSLPLVSIAFLTPILFVRAAPVFGVWRFDARTALLVAWLGLTAVALVLESRQPPANGNWSRWLTAGFIVFASAIWLTIVMDSGIAWFMV